MTKFFSRQYGALIFGACLGSLVSSVSIYPETPGAPALMPMPQHVALGQGQLKIDGNFTVVLEGYKDARVESARKRFLNTLSRETGIPYHDEVTRRQAILTVKTAGADDATLKLGENESYHLEVTPTHALL